MPFVSRQQQLRVRLARERLDALLVTHLPNIRYLTGFSGSNALLLVDGRQSLLFTDGRYRVQAAEEVQQARVILPPAGDLWTAAAKRAAQRSRVGFESDRVTVAQRSRFLRAWAGQAAHFRPIVGWVEQLRSIKEPEEIAALRAAIRLASSVFEATVADIRPGMAETALAGRLEFNLRAAGGEGLAFETIVASGARGAHVHGRPSAQPLPKRGFVVLDYGVILGGYVSDMTRTVHIGRPDRRARQVYEVVRQAQAAAIAAIAPGVACSVVDRAARQIIRAAGLAKFFPHSTGHGVGLEVHEAPRIAATSLDRLAVGQVVTVEPGVYIPDWGGVRIEDVVLVKPEGAEVLTPTAKELLSC